MKTTINLNEVIQFVLKEKDYTLIDSEQLAKDCMISIISEVAMIIDREEIFKVEGDNIIIDE